MLMIMFFLFGQEHEICSDWKTGNECSGWTRIISTHKTTQRLHLKSTIEKWTERKKLRRLIFRLTNFYPQIFDTPLHQQSLSLSESRRPCTEHIPRTTPEMPPHSLQRFTCKFYLLAVSSPSANVVEAVDVGLNLNEVERIGRVTAVDISSVIPLRVYHTELRNKRENNEQFSSLWLLENILRGEGTDSLSDLDIIIIMKRGIIIFSFTGSLNSHLPIWFRYAVPMGI